MNFTSKKLWVTLTLGASLLAPAWAQDKRQDGTPTSSAAKQESAEEVNNSALSAELFYGILLGEINLLLTPDEGSARDAFVLMLDSAERSGDERLYERAVQIAMQNRSGNAALQAVRSWKRAVPASANANRYHIEILIALNRIEESVSLLRQAIRRATPADRVTIIARIPQGYANATDKPKLAALFEKSLSEYLQQKDTAVVSWVTVGRLRLATKDFPGALDAVRMAASLAPDDAAPMALAIELLAPGEPLAEALVKTFLTKHPDSVDIRFAYARTLIQLDRMADARNQIQQVIRSNPTWATPHLILGTVAGEEGDTPQAQSSLQEYLRLSETLPVSEKQRGRSQAYLVLSSVALKSGDYDRALFWLDKIDNPSDPLGLVIQRANIVAKQGQLDEALALVNQYESAEPVQELRKILAQTQLLKEQGLNQRAFDFLQQARKTRKDDADLLLEQAMLAEKLAQFETMESLLREHMALKPHDHAAYNALGYFLADHNQRLDEAKSLIEKAVALVPGDPYITDSLAWVEFRMGHNARAAELLEQAFARKPDAEIGAHLAEVYWSLNRRDEATDVARRALRASRNNAVLTQTIQRLGIPVGRK